jgi:hypothetical protein
MPSINGEKMKIIKLFTLLLLISLMFGCAFSPSLQNMIPVTNQYQFSNINKTITIKMVYGGEKSDPIFKGSRIDDASYMGALLQSLTNFNLFSKVNPSGSPDYYLDVMIISQHQPLAGFDMKVTLLVRYTIINGKDNTQIWQKDIFSQYTAAFGDALVGATRLNKANEGSVRENIRIFLEEISQIKL